MKLASLKKLVARGEGLELEFKRSTGALREAIQTLCGMLNASGSGVVVFGVTDEGEIRGQQVAEKTRREIAQCSRRIEPTAIVDVTEVPSGKGGAAIVVSASAETPGPFSFDGRAYLRVGNTTQRMSHSELERRVAQRLLVETPWDRWPASGWEVGNLDSDEIASTVEDAVHVNKLGGVLGEKTEVILRRLELVTDRGVTRAAAILFGADGGPGYPMGEVRLARFHGVSKGEARDNRQHKGHAFKLLRLAETFLEEHVPVASTLVSGQMRRRDVPRYPTPALREALINAFTHRDYSIDGGAVSVAMFDDRLEVWSTGLLPPGLTPQKLKGQHESVPRNRLIADTFHRRGLVERWGYGTNRMVEVCLAAGCPEPEYEETGGAFVVRFRPASVADTAHAQAISQRGERILAILADATQLGTPEILDRLGENITVRSLQTELKRLRESGLIVSRGRGRATVHAKA